MGIGVHPQFHEPSHKLDVTFTRHGRNERRWVHSVLRFGIPTLFEQTFHKSPPATVYRLVKNEIDFGLGCATLPQKQFDHRHFPRCKCRK